MNRGKMLYGCTMLSYKELLECDRKNKMELEYYKLITTDKEKSHISENFETYGIEIVKKEYTKEDEFNIEKSELHDVTNDEKHIEEILELFKINKVMPISLNDIMYDLMKQTK